MAIPMSWLTCSHSLSQKSQLLKPRSLVVKAKKVRKKRKKSSPLSLQRRKRKRRRTRSLRSSLLLHLSSSADLNQAPKTL